MEADNIASSLKEKTEELAIQVIKMKADKGNINEYRFQKGNDGKGNVIVFLNILQDQQHQKALFFITLMVALSSLLIVSILVIIFSGAAIKPIAKNNEQQKQFITDASHELKTPLTSIGTSLDVLSIDCGENEWTDNIKNQTIRI